MTTIIIIVVVALIFFVSACTITFMVWKSEAEMRTDSIRAIEANLKNLGNKISNVEKQGLEIKSAENGENILMSDIGYRNEHPYSFKKRESLDPFDWAREKMEEPNQELIQEAYAESDEDLEDIQEKRPTSNEEIEETKDRLEYLEEELLKEYQARGIKIGTDDNEDNLFSEELVSLQYDEATEEIESLMDKDEIKEDETKELEPLLYEDKYEEVELEETDYLEVNLDGLDALELDEFDELDELISDEDNSHENVGKSGKKYTSEELELLIRE